MSDVPFTMRLSPEQREALRRRAAESGVPDSAYMRQLLSETAPPSGVWMAYFPAWVSACEAVPFATEVDALRFANGRELMEVKFVPFGTNPLYEEEAQRVSLAEAKLRAEGLL